MFKKGRREEAYQSLCANNDIETAKKIMFDIADSVIDDIELKKNNKMLRAKESLFQKKYVLPFILTCVVLMLQQGTGMNSVLGYAVNIFRQTGLEGEFAN